MNEKTISTIKETVEEILEKMGFSASVAISQEKKTPGSSVI